MNVELYISSSSCVQLRQFRLPHSTSVHINATEIKRQLKYYAKIGTFFRRVYLFLPFPLCVELLDKLLRAHICSSGESSTDVKVKQNMDKKTTVDCFWVGENECPQGKFHCPSLFYFGHFLRTFLLGRSNQEYLRTFHSLVHSCFRQNFWLRLTNLICRKPGECPDEEVTVRIFLRRLFLDPLELPVCTRPTWSDISEPSLEAPSSCAQSSSSNSSWWLPDFRADTTFTRLSPIPSLGSSCISNDLTSILDSGFDSLHSHSSISNAHSQSSSGLITSTPLIITSGSSSNSTKNVQSSQPCMWKAANPLATILESYPFVHQARLLFILYGPVHKGRLMWHIMCENTAADVKQLTACFGELGSVISSMWLSNKWSSDDTIAILHEITTIPDQWLAENFACLLHSAGPQLASLAVKSKAARGRVAELAVILTSLCLVQVKIKENLSGLLGLVGDAVQATGVGYRQGFLDALAYAFRGVIVDLYETDELDERVEDFTIILKAQSYFFRALLARVYEE